MIRATLTPRILALPADVRAALAGASGPGWAKWPNVLPWILQTSAASAGDRVDAWWPANPAAAVAAVVGCGIFEAHLRLAAVADDIIIAGDDHAAALSIIEAHVARSTNG